MIYLQIVSRNSPISISNGQRGIVHDIESKLPKNFFLYATLSLYAVSVSHQYVIRLFLLLLKLNKTIWTAQKYNYRYNWYASEFIVWS